MLRKDYPSKEGRATSWHDEAFDKEPPPPSSSCVEDLCYETALTEASI